MSACTVPLGGFPSVCGLISSSEISARKDLIRERIEVLEKEPLSSFSFNSENELPIYELPTKPLKTSRNRKDSLTQNRNSSSKTKRESIFEKLIKLGLMKKKSNKFKTNKPIQWFRKKERRKYKSKSTYQQSI